MSGHIRRATEATTVAVRKNAHVQWTASKGTARGVVQSVHRVNNVPNVPHLIEASDEAPAARVLLYAPAADGKWTPTSTYLGIPLDRLSVLDEPMAVEEEQTSTEATAGSLDELRRLVRDAIVEHIESLVGTCPYVWVSDLGLDWAVYEAEGLWLVSYTYNQATAVVTITSNPVQVRPVTTYQQVATEAAVVDDNAWRILEAAPSVEGGRVYRVLLIRYGESLNGRLYPADVVRAGAPLYEGAKAFDHHRSPDELTSSTIAGLVGHVRNVEATDVGLEADLHLLPSAQHTAEALDMALANQAEGLPLLVGLSQDIVARWRPVVVGGITKQEAAEIVGVNSVDVVAHPAAGGAPTRMVASNDPTTDPTITRTTEGAITMKTLKELVAALRATESANRPALAGQHAAIVTAAGYTTDEVLAMAAQEAAPPPAPTPAVEAVPSTLANGTILARTVVAAAVEAANLSAALTDTIMAELPARFSEADVTARVASAQRIVEQVEKAGMAPTVRAGEGRNPATFTTDEVDKKRAALEQLVAGNFREGYRSLRQAFVDLAPALGVRLPATATFDPHSAELNRLILREASTIMVHGERTMFDSDLSRGTESVISTTFGELLGDSITRRMVAEYGLPGLSAWRKIVGPNIVPLNDFRTQRVGRMGGYGVLPTVTEGAPYQPLTSPGDEEATYAPTKRGGTEDLTIEAIANDDLRALTRIPTRLGRAAAQTIHRFVWDFLDTNPTIYDGTALFAAGHSNTATNALSGANLSTARAAMRKQQAYGDAYERLGFTPRFLVCATELEELAFQLATSAVALTAAAPVGAATNTPNMHQGIEPIVIDYWTSTTKWMVVADPAMVPTIEVGFYGSEDPALFVQSDNANGSMFNADKVTWKIRHIYGGAVLDYRGFQRGNT